MASSAFRGLYAAVSTPIGANGRPDLGRLHDHCRWVMDHGAHGVCPFGTTGEGVAFSVQERKEALLHLAEQLTASPLMPVVGACSVDDAASLTGFATSLGCSGALLLPPFYYKQPSDDGVYAFYARVIDRVGDDRLRLFAYHIPQLTGVAISHAVVDRLVEDYRGIIAGIKDSSGHPETTTGFCTRYPKLAVFTGTDADIVTTMRAGGAGTVTGMGNINPAALRSVVDHVESPEAVDQCRLAGRLHRIVEHHGGVPAIKALLAHYLNDSAWSEVAPPLVPLPAERVRSLVTELEAEGYVWPR